MTNADDQHLPSPVAPTEERDYADEVSRVSKLLVRLDGETGHESISSHVAALVSEITTLRSQLSKAEADREEAERYRWIRDNVECGLTDKADEDLPALWSFWVPFRRGADGLNKSVDAARSVLPDGAETTDGE